MVGTGGTMGGIGSVVRAYRTTTLFERFRVTYVATHDKGGPAAKVLTAGRGWALVAWKLARLDAPLVHIHLSSRGSFYRKWGVCRLAQLFKRPYVLHVHGSEFMQFYEHECGPRVQRQVQWTFRRAAVVLALSEQWRAHVLSICPDALVEVLPNGVPIPELAAMTRDQAAPAILFLGRLGKRKGTYELIEAFSRIAADFPTARLICAGDGEIASSRALADRLGVGARAEFPGWSDPEQTRRHLAACAIFALPSHAEGLPMALLEAMSWQLAVVATPVGGIPTVLKDQANGLLVQPGDISGLTQALRKLLADDTLRLRLARAARATVAQDYSLEASIGRLTALYGRFGLGDAELEPA
jgi:glycosyltransferase involved in cell wall biosynthesis